MYPYGTSNGDTVLQYSNWVDGNSLVTLPYGFFFGCKLYKQLYVRSWWVLESLLSRKFLFQVSINGYVTFDDSMVQWWTEFFPLSRSRKIPMIAPFWGDFDGHLRMQGISTVFAKVYQKPASGVATGVTKEVLRRANHDVATFKFDPSFDASIVVVITWENMKPYWASFYNTEVCGDYYISLETTLLFFFYRALLSNLF